MNKFFQFHNDYGHETNECNHLKEEIEFLIRQNNAHLKRFGLPQKIVFDNGIQFYSHLFTDFCARHDIKKSFSAVSHPQSNGQVEAVNKILKDTLKKRLEKAKRNWPEKIPEVPWSYKTTKRTTTRDTPFALTYGYEAMLPVEVTPPYHRRTTYDQDCNHQLLVESLDQTEERREKSNIRLAAHQEKVARYFNSRVKEQKFDMGDLVLRRVFPETRDASAGVLGPSLEGPYKFMEIVLPGMY
ncbi:uncharacterized protein LOC133796183 [Humulus lupulus]|uniref:uncharacterized protein LOC133796183 n=1 Tax=Humulus lupulus TaxID=3486 RepID=UPI002B40BCE4|nr:uncharacterized protein LOC133796183 [Humulus lupulus]